MKTVQFHQSGRTSFAVLPALIGRACWTEGERNWSLCFNKRVLPLLKITVIGISKVPHPLPRREKGCLVSPRLHTRRFGLGKVGWSLYSTQRTSPRICAVALMKMVQSQRPSPVYRDVLAAEI